jgi:hypothetical protein
VGRPLALKSHAINYPTYSRGAANDMEILINVLKVLAVLVVAYSTYAVAH